MQSVSVNVCVILTVQCISFDPKDRPSDGNQFADQLEELIRAHPLPEDAVLNVPIGLGSFTQVEMNSKSHNNEKYGGPAWVLHDSYNSRGPMITRTYSYD